MVCFFSCFGVVVRFGVWLRPPYRDMRVTGGEEICVAVGVPPSVGGYLGYSFGAVDVLGAYIYSNTMCP